MKKAIIVIIVAAAAVCACGFGYFETKSANSSNKVLSSSNSTTTSSQTSNLSSNSATDKVNTVSTNSNQSNSSTNQKNNTSNTQSVVANNNSATAVKTANTQTSTLNIPSNFTDSQIQTLENIINAKNISPGAGTDSLVINLDYYSVVNGQKYYKVYGNTIAGMNWNMNPIGPTPNSNGNYSELQFMGYMNQNGQEVSQAQFLNGQLSFNPSDTNNLSQQDIYNMVKKTAIMYATLSGFTHTVQQFNPSELTNYTKNLTVNINNTKNIGGQTYYEVEYVSGQPFYISLTGNIYVSQEHYLSKVFNVPAESNAQIKSEMKGI